MPIRHLPITPVLGVRIEGVDLSRVTQAEFRLLYELWKRHHLLVLPGQRLGTESFAAFCSQFGEPEPAAACAADGEAAWHGDMPHLERPPFASLLWAAGAAATGGDAWFASLPAALRSMPADLVARLRRVAIRHEGGGGAALHPVIIVQPETGEETLFLGRRRDACIAGVAPAESERLLNIVWSYATAQDVTCRHQWQPGDVLLWNNLTTLHRRDAPAAQEALPPHRARIRCRYVLSAPIQKEAA